MGLLGGLSQGLGIAAVVPLFYLMTNQALQGAGRISAVIVWLFHTTHLPVTPPFLLTLIVLLFIGKGFILFATRYFSAHIVSGFEERLRRTLFRRTLHASWPFLMRQKSGHLEGILLYDTEMSAAVINIISDIINIATTFTAYTIVALAISLKITLITLTLGGTLFWVFTPVFRRIRALQTGTAHLQKSTNHHVAEHMASVKSLKAMALEAPVIAYAYSLFARVRTARIKTALYRQASIALFEPVAFILIAVLFILSYRTLGFDIASFGIIMYLVQQMFNYIQSLSNQVQSINHLYPYLKATTDWRRRAGKYAEVDTGSTAFRFQNELAFQGVSFSYRENHPVLNGLNLSIPKGQLLGIIGPSGVGKTTIVDLLLRLFEPTSGTLTVDGTDIHEIGLTDWRHHIAYVPQDGLLLNASVRENIRFYSDVTDAQIEDAARTAHIHDTIMELPGGYDAPVGERGVNLSGGQRQRIILARALARHPDILILDEATSAIDAESERLIHEAIAHLRGMATVIVITHRLATVQHLDRLIVLEQGAIKEEGSPDELMARNDSYLARLHTNA